MHPASTYVRLVAFNRVARLSALYAVAFLFTLTALPADAIGRGPTPKPSPSPTPTKARKTGRLIVQRSPTFGSNRAIRLSIDGRKVADIGKNRHYGDLIPIGRHTLVVRATPETGSRPASMRLTVKQGKLYIYTVGWSGDRLVLQPSTLYNHTPRAN